MNIYSVALTPVAFECVPLLQGRVLEHANPAIASRDNNSSSVMQPCTIHNALIIVATHVNVTLPTKF